MKAIITKYLPATNTKPARIKASTEGGNSITISYPSDDMSQEAAYRKAAEALCAKMNWTGQLYGGGTENGYVFVFGPDCIPALVNALQVAEATIKRLERHAPGSANGTLDVIHAAIEKAVKP